MGRAYVEIIIVAVMAGLLVTRGVYTLVQNSFWISPKVSPATHMTGISATMMGMGQFALAAIIIGGWLFSRPAYRNWGIAVASAGLIAAVGCFGAGIYLNNWRP